MDTYSKSGSVMTITKQVAQNVNYEQLLSDKKFYEDELAKINQLIVEADKLGLKP